MGAKLTFIFTFGRAVPDLTVTATPLSVKLGRFADHLARSGHKATRQREVIARAFFTGARHVTAEELYRVVRDEMPQVGLVTVYRTLKLLREAGLAEERHFGDAHTRFDPNLTERPHDHHHLICTACGRIEEFEEAAVRALSTRAARARGFTVTRHALELYGTCRACGGTRPAATPVAWRSRTRRPAGSHSRPGSP